MIETTNTNVVNDDVTNANDDDVTTSTHRATTRAIRDIASSNIKFDATKREQIVTINKRKIKIVKTNNDTFRVDHANCNHELTKRDRSKCRNEMQMFIRDSIAKQNAK
jgi:hypothetical protein